MMILVLFWFCRKECCRRRRMVRFVWSSAHPFLRKLSVSCIMLIFAPSTLSHTPTREDDVAPAFTSVFFFFFLVVYPIGNPIFTCASFTVTLSHPNVRLSLLSNAATVSAHGNDNLDCTLACGGTFQPRVPWCPPPLPLRCHISALLLLATSARPPSKRKA